MAYKYNYDVTILHFERIRFMKKSKKLVTLLLTLTLCFNVFSFTAFADGGDGSGGGGGKNEPLAVESCSIEDGATDVDTELSIKLNFSKNVADITVRDINTACVSLTKDSGEDVEFEVVYSDDNARRQEFLVNAVLDNSTAYILTISPDLTAKNGMTLDAEYKVSFTTKGDDTMLIAEEDSKDSAKDEASTKEPSEEEKPANNSSMPVIIIVCVIILAVILVVVLKKKKKN